MHQIFHFRTNFADFILEQSLMLSYKRYRFITKAMAIIDFEFAVINCTNLVGLIVYCHCL